MSNTRITIVIGENHTDIAADAFMTELVSRLSAASEEPYVFLDETLPETKLEKLLLDLARNVEVGKHTPALKAYGGDEADHRRMGQRLGKLEGLFKVLQKLGIKYQGIDDAKALEVFDKDKTRGMQLRDDKMATAIMDHAKLGSVICRVGAAHLRGIQTRIVAELGESAETLNRFIFIYPWQKQYDSLSIKESFFETIELEVTDSTVSSSVKEILDEVEKRKEALSLENKMDKTKTKEEDQSFENILEKTPLDKDEDYKADLLFFKNPKNINTKIDLEPDPEDPSSVSKINKQTSF